MKAKNKKDYTKLNLFNQPCVINRSVHPSDIGKVRSNAGLALGVAKYQLAPNCWGKEILASDPGIPSVRGGPHQVTS